MNFLSSTSAMLSYTSGATLTSSVLESVMLLLLGTATARFQALVAALVSLMIGCQTQPAPEPTAEPQPQAEVAEDQTAPRSGDATTPVVETESAQVGPTGPPHPPLTARPEGRIIDAHSHLMGYEVWPEVERVLDENHIDFIFNLSGGSPRRGQSLAMMLARDSGGRVANLMTIDWEGIDEVAFGEVLAAELELLVSQYGYVGLKVSKALGLFARDGYGQLIDVDDPRLFPLWEMAGELGVPVFIHTADPLAFWDPTTPGNERYAELSVHPGWSFHGPEFPSREELLAERDHLLQLFPETTFVGVHFGNNPEDPEYVAELLDEHPNLYVDLAARVPELGRHDPERIREIFVQHQNRILFATDIVVVKQRGQTSYTLGSGGEEPDVYEEVGPFYDTHDRWLRTHDHAFAHPTPIQGDWTIDAIGLSDEVLDRIYYLNAYELVLEGRVTNVVLPVE